MSAPHFGIDRLPAMDRSKVDAFLLNAYDATIMMLLFLAPLFMGGRHPAGRFVFVVLALSAAAIWCARQSFSASRTWRHSALQWIFAAAVGLVLLQLVPLPETLHRLLSPHTSDVLPLWSAGSEFRLGSWTTLSLAPYETRIGLLVLLGYAAVFITACQRLTNSHDIERLFRWIALATFGMALLGLVQYLAGNGKFLWVYLHPFRDAAFVQGPFVNRNHFVQFLAVGIGPLLYLLYRELQRDRNPKKSNRGFSRSKSMSDRWQIYAYGGMLLIVLFAAFLSLSRGGILTVACVLMVCTGLAIWKKLLDRRSLIVVGSAAAIVFVALAIHGMGNFTDRLESLSSLSEDRSANLRMLIWQANWQVVQSFPIAGTGAGSHTEVYPLFLDSDTRSKFTHAENGYLQVLSENGGIGSLLLLAGIVVVGRWALLAITGRGEGKHSALAVATIASLAAPLVHGCVDFVWWIPACMTPTLLLLACLWFQAHRAAESTVPAEPRGEAPPLEWRWGAAALAGCLVVFAAATYLWGPARASGHWDQYLAISLATKSFRLDAEASGATANLGKLDPQSPTAVGQMARHLQLALKHDPLNPRLNARQAAMRLRQFGLAQEQSTNPMGLAMIRDAALASQFGSRREQHEWLQTALGDNLALLIDARRCTRRAIAGSPLQGEVYASMAELSFMESPRPQRKAALVQQALLARPYSGNVLLSAGREAAIAGDHDKAIELLKQAFHAERETQKLVIELIASQTPIEEFVKAFEPDIEAVRMLRNHFRELGIPPAIEQANVLLADRAMAEAKLAEGHPASVLYLEAGRCYIDLARFDEAEAATALAVRSAPLDFDAREQWAKCLMAVGDYREAEKQWKWCLSRRPGDDNLRRQLAAAQHAELAAWPTDANR